MVVGSKAGIVPATVPIRAVLSVGRNHAQGIKTTDSSPTTHWTGVRSTGKTIHLYWPTNKLLNMLRDLFPKRLLQRLQKVLTRYLCQRCLLWTILYISHTAALLLPAAGHSLHPRSRPEYPSPRTYPQHLPVSREPLQNQVSGPDCIFDSLKN